MHHKQEYFPITSVHRSDLEGLGYDVSDADDGTMAQLASKMANAYLEEVFWIDLPIIADHLGIPKKAVEDDVTNLKDSSPARAERPC